MMKQQKKNVTTGKNLYFPCSLLNTAPRINNKLTNNKPNPDIIKISKLVEKM